MCYPNIALTGKFRSGKDEVAKYLCARYGYTQFAFGDELKRYYHELFGHTDAKPREGYQWFGQTMRARDPDIWVRKCFDYIEHDNTAFGKYAFYHSDCGGWIADGQFRIIDDSRTGAEAEEYGL